ncbi:efflux RND transporter periplasmic adaptor subunit [Halomonas binhaiensis]|uniref:Efflux RND transporter periplasmic adaptor subunit n=1 Tax=Halomonas binhaiensis TaxID=2562282 RepID=A0A856QVD5_9GAMM|nr:efflux RND transporter periplasmic adaptor subunit [Halomonas binhaiensis]QEM83853.2 efflux RND transporter periplasmic adaptor subunit [Halomonas binhaiensis]
MGEAMLSEQSLLRVPAMIVLALLVAPASLSVQAQERLGEAPAGMQIQTETAGQAEAEVPAPTPEMERRMEQVRENPEALRMRMLLAPQQEATLSSRMDGTLEELPVELGDNVAEGDMLARFDCRVQQARVNAANTEISVARLNYDAKRSLRRLDAVGDHEVALAQAEVEKAQSALNLAAVERDQCTLKAPFSGRIAKVHVKPYQTMGSGTPVVDLVGDGALKVRLNAPSVLLPRLQVGQPLDIAVNETEQHYGATLSAISARIDAVAQTVALEATLDASHEELRPGMTGSAQVRFETAAQAPAEPTQE